MLLTFAGICFATWAAKERPDLDSNPDICNAGAVLHQLSYQANWELLIMCVYGKPVDIVDIQYISSKIISIEINNEGLWAKTS